MSVLRKPDVTKIQTDYNVQQEELSISAARKKKLLFRRLAAFSICALAIGFFMISTLISQGSVLEEKAAEKKKLDGKIALLEKEEKSLKEQIVKLNDEDYLAKLARKDLLLSEKGEIIFNIPDGKNKPNDNGN
ncbi:septum formation initiator family protein [Niallia taxi]|uniref:FtsB family cell division protein n=1 Tax=Niallia taxi TaxID=2499688 RepID=UPI001243E559|nr:septum formation initiator family protein [Niallia taxi]MCM3218060.1 septum formation initiator family protein [Niallia taxi]MDK8643260.1 septum formation initiator family protein [Niallia taxi]MED4040146.1 septum formation initiator family protein [Niallia taxi]MED4056152.1 septum formation initiator family protein [Niallia taxi]MED4120594.1 septum formation initiator family protein [Niallia taxi]